jgi:hypothetical protein
MNMTESIVCRTERANPAQSIALSSKGLGMFCAQKLKTLTIFLLNSRVKCDS